MFVIKVNRRTNTSVNYYEYYTPHVEKNIILHKDYLKSSNPVIIGHLNMACYKVSCVEMKTDFGSVFISTHETL